MTRPNMETGDPLPPQPLIINNFLKQFKMKTTLIITIAAAALAMAGCNSNEVPDNGPVQLRLTSGIKVQTRATHSLDRQFKTGEVIHLWVDDAKDTQAQVDRENLYEDNKLTADGSGNLTGRSPMYFPQTGNGVNIYALHTNAAISGAFPATELTHTVAADQKITTTTAGNGYQGSDLAFAKSTGVARAKNPVALTFTHLLSKVEVVLVTGNGSPEISKMEILNTKLEAKFTPDKTTPFAVTAAGVPAPIEIDPEVTSSVNAEGNNEALKKLNEAVIVPQTLAENSPFIQLTTTGGGILTYPLAASATFEAGKKYRYTVTANLTGLTVTSEITEWGDGGTVVGNAEMQ